jgi:hypothetical protein
VIKGWLVPPNIWKFLKKIRAQALHKKSVSKIDSLKKNESGACFILASGPSILKQDLTLLEGMDVIAVSHFHVHPDIKKIKPKYHVLAPFHKPFDFSDAKKYFDDFKKSYDPKEVEIFLGYRPYKFSFQNFLKQTSEYNDYNFETIDYTNSSQLDEDNCNHDEVWDIFQKPFECRTVIYSAIQLAYNLGYKEIYLLGCDHDYIFTKGREKGNRFYNDDNGIDDSKHLDAFDMEKWFLEYYMRWKQYRLMRTFLKSKNVRIYNATHGGYLDVFKRKKYEEVIKKNNI